MLHLDLAYPHADLQLFVDIIRHERKGALNRANQGIQQRDKLTQAPGYSLQPPILVSGDPVQKRPEPVKAEPQLSQRGEDVLYGSELCIELGLTHICSLPKFGFNSLPLLFERIPVFLELFVEFAFIVSQPAIGKMTTQSLLQPPTPACRYLLSKREKSSMKNLARAKV